MSNREGILALTGVHNAAAEKLTYFLMATAGASIGFVMTQRFTVSFAWPDLLLIFAIACWAFSFWAGVRALRITLRFMRANALYLEQITQHPGDQKTILEIATRSSFDPDQKELLEWQNTELRFLIAGAGVLLVERIASAYPNFNPFSFF